LHEPQPSNTAWKLLPADTAYSSFAIHHSEVIVIPLDELRAPFDAFLRALFAKQ